MSDERVDLVVRAVGFEEVGDPPVKVASAAEGADGSGFGFEFQLASVFDEQDRQTGMDTYCICTSEGAAHYGGVVAVAFEEAAITLDLDAAVAARLNVPEKFRLCLEVSEVARRRFSDGLRRVLGAQV